MRTRRMRMVAVIGAVAIGILAAVPGLVVGGIQAAGTAVASASPVASPAVQRTIQLGSGASITLRAFTSTGDALPADPNADPDAYQACRDVATPPPGTIPKVTYHDPDPPAGQLQAGGAPQDYMQWTSQNLVPPVGAGTEAGASAYGGGWANASKPAGSAMVPPAMVVSDNLRTYPNPPVDPPPYSDPSDPGATSAIWNAGADSPGGLWVAQKTPTADDRVYYCQLLLGQLDNDPAAPFPATNAEATFPPVQASFLGYGFVPVTATVHLAEQASGSALSPVAEVAYQQYKHYDGTTGTIGDCSGTLGPDGGPCGFNYCQGGTGGSQCSAIVITVAAAVTLRLTDVTVNGTPLDVGSHCQTAGPLYTPDSPIEDPHNDLAVLQGGSDPSEPAPQWVSTGTTNKAEGQGAIFVGGAVAGNVTIPSLTGCVTPSGENLDALLDSAVSGPGNYVKMTAGGACSDITSYNCESAKPPILGGLALPPDTTSCPLPLCFPLKELSR